jgi:hypothetical protein
LETVSEYVFEYGDPQGLTNDDVREMFREDEWRALRVRVRENLATVLDHVREGQQESSSEKDDPADVIEPFSQLCATLGLEFSDDAEAAETIQKERDRAQNWIENVLSNRPGEPDYDREMYRGGSAPATETSRSIFEDIDS